MIINATTSWTVSVDVDVTVPESSGTVCNDARLEGESGTVSVVIGKTQVGTDPVTGAPIYEPIYYSFPCCVGADLTASSCVDVGGEGKFEDGDFCTYPSSDWKVGQNGDTTPDVLLADHFDAVFPDGLTIGIDDGAGSQHSAKWTAVNKLQVWLAGGGIGASGPLTEDTLNATSTSGGDLARSAGALTLNVAYSAADDYTGLPGNHFGDLVVCSLAEGVVIDAAPGPVWTVTATQAAAVNGQTVQQVLDATNIALAGGVLPYGLSYQELNQLLAALNGAFQSCEVRSFASLFLCWP